MFIILKARSTLPRWGAFLELYDTAVLCKGEQRGDAALFILLPFSLKSQTTAALPKHVRCQRAPQASRPFGAGSLRSARAQEHSRVSGAKKLLEPNAQKEHVPRLHPEGTELKTNHVCHAHAHLKSCVRCACVYGVAPVEARVWNTRNRFQEESCLMLFFVFVSLVQPKSKQLYLTA